MALMSLEERQDSGPYNGYYAGMSQLMAIVALCALVIGLALPWTAVLITSTHHPYLSIAKALALTGEPGLLRVFSWSCLGTSGALVAFSIYRSLSKRIKAGGPEADYLDRIRSQFASLLLIGGVLFLFAMGPR